MNGLHEEFFGVLQLCFILSVVLTVQIFAFVTPHKTMCQNMAFSICKMQKKIKNTGKMI